MSDLRQAASSVSRASLDVRWTARALRAAGHEEQADEMERVLREMEALEERLYEWEPILALAARFP